MVLCRVKLGKDDFLTESASPVFSSTKATPESNKQEGDALSIESVDDESSCLSEPGWRDYWESFEKEPPAPVTLEEKWEALEKEFNHRERLLHRISKRKNKRFVDKLWEREIAVRRQAFDKLLFSVDAQQATEKELEEYQEQLDFEEESMLEQHPKRRNTIVHKILDWFVYELNSTIPATICLLIHCIAHVGIYDCISSCVDTVRKWTCGTSEGPLIDATYYGSVFLCGTLLMRSTGDLFWWLTDQDYDCIKFDFHNRRRLGCWQAGLLSTVRRSRIFRVLLYMIGYHLCYITSDILAEYFQWIFDQNEEVLKKLPSVLCEEEKDFCPVVLTEPFWTRTCQDEIERQEQEYVSLKQADLLYTWNMLSLSSYEGYWQQWVHSDDIIDAEYTPLYKQVDHVYMCFGTAVISILLLRIYPGFRFWDKYF